MDFHAKHASESGRLEQIISQFLLKVLHIILDSRIPSLKPRNRSGDRLTNSKVRKSDRWFHLALGDRPAALENLQFWHRNLMDPMVIDIIVVHRGQQGGSDANFSARDVSPDVAAVETVIERWVVQFENARAMSLQTGDFSSSYKRTYKKSILLFRSLHSMMRFLPAYRIFRHFNSYSQNPEYDVIYKVSTFSDPFSREEEKLMKQYSFVPVETVNGRLCVSVTYRSVLSEFSPESLTSFPPMIIADYVGSPAADPMRAFPSMDKGLRTASISIQGTRSPPSMALQRPHSWSSGAPYMQNQGFIGSPPVHRGSYMPNEFQSSPGSIHGQRIQNQRQPSGYYNTNSSDEYQLSPPFSPSSSPSPPAYLLSHSPGNSRLRSESAPVSIPHAMLTRSPRYLSPNFLSDPNRPSLPPLSPRSTRNDPSLDESSSGLRASKKLEALRSGEPFSGISSQSFCTKMSRDSRDDSGRFSGLLSSGSSHHVGSSSRLSFQDDLDECDFACPFDVDDVDTSGSPSSQNYDGRKGLEFASGLSMGRKSQDAEVGALVQMLRTAPPLRQDSSCYSARSSPIYEQEGNFGTASGFFMPRKASDALEELKSYRDMKDLLLSKSGTRVISKEHT